MFVHSLSYSWLLFSLDSVDYRSHNLIIAHIHHAYEHNLHNPRSPFLTILVSAIQFSYTSVFGWYASYLFITTQTIWAPALVHTFCNAMGLPRIWGGIPGVAGWKVAVYYICLVLGATAFVTFIGRIKPSEMQI
jgi:prenyl protein peptidase